MKKNETWINNETITKHDQQRNNNKTRLNNRMHDHEEDIFVMDDTYFDTPVVNNRSKADKLEIPVYTNYSTGWKLVEKLLRAFEDSSYEERLFVKISSRCLLNSEFNQKFGIGALPPCYCSETIQNLSPIFQVFYQLAYLSTVTKFPRRVAHHYFQKVFCSNFPIFITINCWRW